MKSKALIYVFAVLIGLFSYSCKPKDSDVQKIVQTELTKDYPNYKLEVAVKDGVTTLTGEVATDVEKDIIENIVKSIKSVESVTNNITVKSAVPEVVINPDSVLEKAISSAFELAGFKGINLAVKEGEVTLTGNAKRSDLEKIMQIANEAQPKKVINELKLK